MNHGGRMAGMGTRTGIGIGTGIMGGRPSPNRDGIDWARLHALETLWDPGSRDILAGLGIQAGWRCLELGAGTGSLARWLAHRCQRGNVVATEVDLRFLRADRVPNREIVAHDLVKGEDFPAESYDLVHTRAVLAHLPDRDHVVERAARWLAPGGWLSGH